MQPYLVTATGVSLFSRMLWSVGADVAHRVADGPTARGRPPQPLDPDIHLPQLEISADLRELLEPGPFGQPGSVAPAGADVFADPAATTRAFPKTSTTATTSQKTTRTTALAIATAVVPASTMATTHPADAVVDLVKRAESLTQLRSFEQNVEKRLPQLRMRQLGGLNALLKGDVYFYKESDIALTIPCAESIHKNAAGVYSARYPVGKGRGLRVDAAYMRRRAVLVAHAANAHLVRISPDRRNWKTTAVYTDDVIEVEKAAMWARILASAVPLRDQENNWSKWLKWG